MGSGNLGNIWEKSNLICMLRNKVWCYNIRFTNLFDVLIIFGKSYLIIKMLCMQSFECIYTLDLYVYLNYYSVKYNHIYRSEKAFANIVTTIADDFYGLYRHNLHNLQNPRVKKLTIITDSTNYKNTLHAWRL